MKNKNLFNKKSLKSFRSSLRKRSTAAEVAFWDILKSKNLDGRKFRRQHSIGSYIVDFCCPSEQLIMELDGASHGEYHKPINHPGRQRYLQLLDYHEVRPPLLQKEGRILIKL